MAPQSIERMQIAGGAKGLHSITQAMLTAAITCFRFSFQANTAIMTRLTAPNVSCLAQFAVT